MDGGVSQTAGSMEFGIWRWWLLVAYATDCEK
jgi:hypothetical protein